MFKDAQQVAEVGYCEVCDSEFYPRDEVLLYDNCHFCDWHCLIEHMSPAVMTVELNGK